ncbi:MAG TPA: N-acetylmuramic acid 6-phosphate etherase [Bacteroidota bacterium]|nr:N-acetylmuramic acid 6-phosphate etherase [Bacteroidota bacterium]
MSSRKLFQQLGLLSTEQRNRATMNIDALGTPEILERINAQDRLVAGAVRNEISHISSAVELIVSSLKKGGRLVYVGAGTSGRLGVLDAAECPPTYGTSPSMIQACIAGGRGSVFRSREGAEDRDSEGRRDIDQRHVGPDDVVCGIAASMRTPYVQAALVRAKKRGARTILVTTNPRSLLRKPQFLGLSRSADIAICVEVGPEAIMGSTRMKAGTAQKLVLNMLTTASMIRLGKVYGNMMVDLRMNSRKLEERAKKVLMIAAGVNYPTAERFLKKAGGDVKTALIMILADVSAARARTFLKHEDGSVRGALKAAGKGNFAL